MAVIPLSTINYGIVIVITVSCVQTPVPAVGVAESKYDLTMHPSWLQTLRAQI